MVKFGKGVVKCRILILILGVLLLIPSLFGMLSTRINYDMLTYLPEDMDTVKGQNILLDDFGKGAFSMVVVEGLETKEVADLKEKIQQVDHVESVIWYDSLMDLSVPMELLPEKYYDAFNNGDATVMAVFFDTSTSADETMEAITQIRQTTEGQCFVSGMSAMVTDLKALCEQEEPIYVGLAVLFATIAMMLFLDSWILPFIFLASIGMAILYNLGSNFMLGEISYVTKALAAVLQLAVTMDYSIFLWHSYSEEKCNFNGDRKEAMAQAIAHTITSVVGSSITTIAGFIALCFMSFTLGWDLGIVMAKGVLLGVICCVTVLPSLILVLDRPIEKTMHRSLLPKMDGLSRFITKRAWVFLAIFLVIVGPALYGYSNTKMYYDFSESLPQDLDYMIANTKLKDRFDISTTHMILADAKMEAKDAQAMIKEIDQVDGVSYALGFNSVVGSAVPEEILPSSITDLLKNDKYQLFLINSQYSVASDEVNGQITQINNILKKYDPNGMLRSISLPVILVAVIEFAVFINLGIPFYTNVSLPFVAPICISTIQLGATVDYAILMTTRYKRERFQGHNKKEAVSIALSTSISSILVSALGFFAATFGVGLYSNIDMISSMCNLMARGAIISMLSVMFILPAMLLLFDPVIGKTTLGFRPKKQKVSQ